MENIDSKLNSYLNKIRLSEQPEDTEIKDTEPETDDTEVGSNMTSDTGVGNDMSGVAMGGIPGDEEQAAKTDVQISKVYELKKIFVRLTSLENFLSDSNDEKLLRIRKYILEALDLFKLVISNLKLYLNKIDDIIITYYEFLKIIYTIIKKYFDKKQSESK